MTKIKVLSPEVFADPESPTSVRRGMIEECVYAARRVQAVAEEAHHGYTNGGGDFGQPKASMYCSPLIERDQSAFVPKSNSDSAQISGLSSNLSITLDSGRHNPARTMPWQNYCW